MKTCREALARNELSIVLFFRMETNKAMLSSFVLQRFRVSSKFRPPNTLVPCFGNQIRLRQDKLICFVEVNIPWKVSIVFFFCCTHRDLGRLGGGVLCRVLRLLSSRSTYNRRPRMTQANKRVFVFGLWFDGRVTLRSVFQGTVRLITLLSCMHLSYSVRLTISLLEKYLSTFIFLKTNYFSNHIILLFEPSLIEVRYL